MKTTSASKKAQRDFQSNKETGGVERGRNRKGRLFVPITLSLSGHMQSDVGAASMEFIYGLR